MKGYYQITLCLISYKFVANPKDQKELPLVETKSQSRSSLGLSCWQKKELQNLSAQELRNKNMAWVPKRNSQNKTDACPPIAPSVT